MHNLWITLRAESYPHRIHRLSTGYPPVFHIFILLSLHELREGSRRARARELNNNILLVNPVVFGLRGIRDGDSVPGTEEFSRRHKGAFLAEVGFGISGEFACGLGEECSARVVAGYEWNAGAYEVKKDVVDFA